MKTKEKISRWNFLFFIVVSFYSIGAGFVESLVNYPLWKIIGTSSIWQEYHIALHPKIIPVLAIPALLLQLITNVLLLLFRPVFVSRWMAWATLTLLSVSLISSAIIQIPIQVQLDSGYSNLLMQKLIESDLLYRITVALVRCLFIMYMMHSLMRKINFSAGLLNNKYQHKNAGDRMIA